MGLGQLMTELRVVAPLPDEVLVIRQRGLEELPAQTPAIEGVLFLQEGILADDGEVFAYGPVGHLEIRLREGAGLGLPATALLDHNHADGRGQRDADQGGAGGVGPGAVLAEPACQPLQTPLGVGRNWFVGQPVFEVPRQVAHRGVPQFGPEGHRLQADRIQGSR